MGRDGPRPPPLLPLSTGALLPSFLHDPRFLLSSFSDGVPPSSSLGLPLFCRPGCLRPDLDLSLFLDQDPTLLRSRHLFRAPCAPHPGTTDGRGIELFTRLPVCLSFVSLSTVSLYASFSSPSLRLRVGTGDDGSRGSFLPRPSGAW